MDRNVTRGGKDKVYHLWADEGHPVIVLDPAGGSHRNVAVYYLC